MNLFAHKRTGKKQAVEILQFRMPNSGSDDLQILIASFAINLLSLALPVMTLQVYDRILAYKNAGTLHILAIAVSVTILLETALRIARAYVSGWSGACFDHLSACAAIRHIAHADLLASTRREAGEYLQDMAAFTKLREFQRGQLLSTLVDLPFLLIFIGLIYYLAGWLVMAPLVMLGVFSLLAWLNGRNIRSGLQDRDESDDKRFSFMIEVLRGIHSVKSLALEAPLQRRYEGMQSDAGILNYRAAYANGVAGSMGALFSQLMMVAVIVVGAPMVMEEWISIGALIACVLLSGRMMQPVQRALQLWVRYQDYQLARERSEKIFAMPSGSAVQSQEGVAPIPQNDGRLECVEVAFGYDSGNAMLLNDVNLSLSLGETIAISSTHSNGRSTLMKLLAGIYQPTRGHVLVNGVDASRLSAEEITRHIAYIPTDGVMFRGTIMENLTGFHAEREAKAREMAQLLGVDAAVSRLPMGYDTLLEGGVADAIPPGLKQRIAISRVLVEKPRILLFNQSERALDREGYNHLFRLLARLKGRVTMVLACDDRNIAQLADRHYELRYGRLVEVTSTEEHATPIQLRESPAFGPSGVGESSPNPTLRAAPWAGGVSQS